MKDHRKLAKPVRSLTSLVRPKYSPGLLLQDDDLTAAVSYTRNLSRLMFRSLFGCGVLCGLEVGAPHKDNCGKLLIDVDKGLALSCIGDPIEVPASQVMIDTCENELPCFLWIAVKHIEACCVPRTAECSPDGDEPGSAPTRERDGFEIRVFPERPPCSCGCNRLGDSAMSQHDSAADGTASSKRLPQIKKKVRGNTSVAAMSGTAQSTATAGLASAASVDSPCHYPEEYENQSTLPADPCLCNQRTADGACYDAHYKGKCPCDCCDCEWIILAVASRLDADGATWDIDHSVRRFVRPVFMRDWKVEDERLHRGS